MKTRLITGLILLAVLVPLFVIGGLALDLLLVIFSMMASFEMARMFLKEVKQPQFVVWSEVVLSGALFYALRSFFIGDWSLEWAFFGIIFMVIFGAMLMVFYENFSSKQFGEMFVVVLYPSLGFSTISALRYMNDGLLVIGFLFMVTIMTDTFAYVFGVRFGKHRLAEKISPKKSVEGSVYGSLSAVVLTLIYVLVTKLPSIGQIQLSILVTIVLILIISIVGQIGDLVASKLKRDNDIKDYSNLFPGHGGVMDRFDSAIFAAMVLVFLSEVVGLL
jgi:phosphatidate cytidylyltransferase